MEAELYIEDERGRRIYGKAKAFHVLQYVAQEHPHLSRKDWQETYRLVASRAYAKTKGEYEFIQEGN